MSGSPAGPLAGVKVLDFATVGPAARASRILADYGAEVVKLGAVPRAGGVQIVPPYYAYSGNRGAERMLLDLKHPEGKAAFLDLAADADVVIESFRPGVVSRLGIDVDAVAEVNPGIVYCSTSGFGQTGPRSQWAGHDVNYLAVGGFLHCNGRRADGGPPLPGATVADIAAGGMQAAMAIMAALLGRDSELPTPNHLDVSIADGVVAMMGLYVDEYLATGTEPGPGHYILTGKYACYDIYECSDGGWLSVGAIEGHFFAKLCELLGLEQHAAHQMDDDQQDQMRSDFAAAFATRPRDEWVAELGPADCCVAPVLDIAEVVIDEHFAARGLVADATHETEGAFRQLGRIWAGTPSTEGPEQIRQATATDTVALLAAAGYDSERLNRLVEEGVVA